MPRKVMIIAPNSNGGITAVVKSLFKGGLDQYDNLIYHASTFEGSGIKKGLFFIKQYIKGIYLFSLFRPDLIHVHMSTNGSFVRKTFYILLGKLSSKKIIIHIHPTHFLDFIEKCNRFKRTIVLKILDMGDMIITLTYNMKKELHYYFKSKEIKVLRNPIVIDDFEFIDISVREKNSLLYLGWIIEKKGVYDLLSAAPIVKKEINDFKLVYCGNKETNKLKNMIHSRGLSDYVQVNEWIDVKQKKRLLRTSNAIILPTYSEGIPNVILEAMASGLPIITCPVGGIREILKEPINCLYVKPGDINEIAQKIIMLLKQIELQRSIAINNYNTVKKFDAKNIVKQLIQYYYSEKNP
jgi:glycosyltransferase involved in cell wall biosynthesis